LTITKSVALGEIELDLEQEPLRRWPILLIAALVAFKALGCYCIAEGP